MFENIDMGVAKYDADAVVKVLVGLGVGAEMLWNTMCLAVDAAASDEAVFDTTNINAVEHDVVTFQDVVIVVVEKGSVDTVLQNTRW